uniref:hypothetical protein n=1 Tax=Deinococcus sp. TaxID=47478 RepID=UPI0025C14ABF
MAGGIPMSAPQQELTLGQVLRMAKPKAGGVSQAGEKTEEVAKRIKELETKILKLEAGTPEHKAARWELNQLEGGPWTYDHWSKVYEANILKAKKSNAGVAAYQKTLGWGEVEVTVDAGGSPRRLDIADIKTQKAVEVKEYSTGYITHAADIASEIERDAILVSEGWDIT